MYHFYAYLSRMRYINRWSLMYNTNTENVSEHSLMTSVLAHALALIRRDIFGKEINVDHVALCALYHDVPEVFTGDLPTPIKYWSPEIRNAVQEVETSSIERLLSFLPKELKSSYDSLIRPDDPEIVQLIHASDKLSAYIKCIEEQKGGNGEFNKAGQQLMNKLKCLNLPEVDYFLQNFLPSFRLTLDELQ